MSEKDKATLPRRQFVKMTGVTAIGATLLPLAGCGGDSGSADTGSVTDAAEDAVNDAASAVADAADDAMDAASDAASDAATWSKRRRTMRLMRRARCWKMPKTP